MQRDDTRPQPFPTLRALLCATAMLMVAGLGARPAAAQSDMAAAGKAFSQAQAAELQGNWQQAASLYELAASIAPSPEAMRAALRARRHTGDDAKAATWALELQRRHPTDGPSRELATKTLDELRPKLVELTANCTPTPCTLDLDGQAAGTEAQASHHLFVNPGSHALVAAFGSRRTDLQKLDAEAAESAELSFTEPTTPAVSAAAGDGGGSDAYADSEDDVPATAATPGGDSSGSHGLSPAIAITGMVLTAGLGGVTIWSGVDTLSAADTYKQAPTEQGYLDGEDLELRTDVLIAATAAVGVATAAVALFATDWGGDEALSDTATLPLLVVGPDQVGAQWMLRF